MRTNCLVLLFSFFILGASAQIQQENSDSIRLRCSGTIAANDVLYIVDGVLSDQNGIMKLNPADILSIDLLKDTNNKIISCRIPPTVILITTKKSNQKVFVVVDAKSNTGIAGASIQFRSSKTGKAFSFITNDFGRFETEMLVANNDRILISATGYEPITLTGKEALQLKYRVQLKQKFIELEEIYVVAYRTIKCGRGGYMQFPASKIESTNQDLSCKFFGASIKQKVIVNVETLQLTEQKMSVYPNPVANGSTVRFSFLKLQPGVYQVRLFNNGGQLVRSFQKQISGKNETEQIHLSNLMAAGVYMVQVTDEKNKLVQHSKLIIQ